MHLVIHTRLLSAKARVRLVVVMVLMSFPVCSQNSTIQLTSQTIGPFNLLWATKPYTGLTVGADYLFQCDVDVNAVPVNLNMAGTTVSAGVDGNYQILFTASATTHNLNVFAFTLFTPPFSVELDNLELLEVSDSMFMAYLFEYRNGYRYAYNGKEKDDEVKNGVGNHYAYGFRDYDPRLGRFLSIDAFDDAYPWLTPYHYTDNSPVLYIDVDGLQPTISGVGGKIVLTNPTGNKIKLQAGLGIQLSYNNDYIHSMTLNVNNFGTGGQPSVNLFMNASITPSDNPQFMMGVGFQGDGDGSVDVTGYAGGSSQADFNEVETELSPDVENPFNGEGLVATGTAIAGLVFDPPAEDLEEQMEKNAEAINEPIEAIAETNAEGQPVTTEDPTAFMPEGKPEKQSLEEKTSEAIEEGVENSQQEYVQPTEIPPTLEQLKWAILNMEKKTVIPNTGSTGAGPVRR